ncbi:MAG: ATP-binding cassette domain-containing protein [Chloroherpetonaceae bacterium]
MPSLRADALKKVYDRKIIFQNVSFALAPHEWLAITGANGSGKSTLLKILAAQASATSGTVTYTLDGATLTPEQTRPYIGFVSPYLNFYDELSGIENVSFALRAKGLPLFKREVDELFDYFRLSEAKSKRVKTYSSGMIQRLRFVQAFASNPKFLFLDEPTATLDDDGKSLFWNKLNQLISQTVIVIASNDHDEIAHCTSTLCIEAFKLTKNILS